MDAIMTLVTMLICSLDTDDYKANAYPYLAERYQNLKRDYELLAEKLPFMRYLDDALIERVAYDIGDFIGDDEQELMSCHVTEFIRHEMEEMHQAIKACL